MSAVERTTAGQLAGFDGAMVTDTSLRFRPDITEERATQIAMLLARIDRSARWWLGSWVVEYTARFGGDDGTRALAVASDATGYSESSLANFRDAVSFLPERTRDARLDFSSHVELTRLVRAGLGIEVVEEVRDRLIEMRQSHVNGPFPSHKIARKVVSEVIRERGLADRMFHFPTTEEQLADTAAERDRLAGELERERLASGSYVRCPGCGKAQPASEARLA